MTSFSNPNYGLDALNSNCLLQSADSSSHDRDDIVDNMSSVIDQRQYQTDNGLPFDKVLPAFTPATYTLSLLSIHYIIDREFEFLRKLKIFSSSRIF